MTDSIEDFEAFLQQARVLVASLHAISSGLLAELGCTEAERGVLQDLELRGPQPVPALAEARGVSRQAMQKTIDRMAAQQWVAAENNPRHQRSPLIAIAKAGRKLFGQVRARESRAFSKLKLPLSGKELRQTTQALEAMGPLSRR